MEKLVKIYHILHRNFVHAGKASIAVKNLLKSLRISPEIVRRVAVCGYEGEMNVVMHSSDGGMMQLELSAARIIIKVSDRGPGISDINQAMQKGFSTATDEFRAMGFGAGMGLPNMQKNADIFHVRSSPGEGTVITMEFDNRG